MNIRDLHYLVAVAETLHFGKAAELCNTSQPTLSMQLKKLEESLGVQIFERTNKKVMITPIGQIILAKAKRILQDSKDISEIAKAAQDPFAGELRLGAFPTLAPYFLPLIVPAIHKKFPKLKLLLVEEKTDILIERLKAGTLDAAFLALPIEDDALEQDFLFDDPFFLAVANNHKLAQKKSITNHDIQSEQLLLLEDGHCMRSQALEVCSMVGTSESNEFRATSLETLRQMVATSVGITLMPKIAVRKDEFVTYLPFEGLSPVRSIGIVWRKSTVRGKSIRAIKEVIVSLYLSGSFS